MRWAQRIRLGFLSEGAFFGEAAVLADESGRELRRRTLKAVTDSELCYINREDIQALRVEYPELDARLKRFVNVGNIRLSKKNALGKLFPELAITESGMTKSQVEAEQRRLVGEYTSSHNDMKHAKKAGSEDGGALLQQPGVDKAEPLLPGGGLPEEKLRAVETQLSQLQTVLNRELGALHSKSDSLQDSLQAILGKLDDR